MTEHGKHFIEEYKKGNVMLNSMQTLYEKGHITKEEYTDVVGEEPKNKQIDICDEPTAEERITQLEADKEALAQNVYMLAEVLEALLGGEEDGQEESITEDTAS